jgi:hypothetical protein
MQLHFFLSLAVVLQGEMWCKYMHKRWERGSGDVTERSTLEKHAIYEHMLFRSLKENTTTQAFSR